MFGVYMYVFREFFLYVCMYVPRKLYRKGILLQYKVQRYPRRTNLCCGRFMYSTHFFLGKVYTVLPREYRYVINSGYFVMPVIHCIHYNQLCITCVCYIFCAWCFMICCTCIELHFLGKVHYRIRTT